MGHLRTIVTAALLVVAFMTLLYYAQSPQRTFVATTGAPAAVVVGAEEVPAVSSGVEGTVLLRPTCPNVQSPLSPACADQPYRAAVSVYRPGSPDPLVSMRSREDGSFDFALSPGTYEIRVDTGTILPRCAPVSVQIPPDGRVSTVVYCDSGIR